MKPSTSLGSTGITMPSDTTSITTRAKMKATVALRITPELSSMPAERVRRLGGEWPELLLELVHGPVAQRTGNVNRRRGPSIGADDRAGHHLLAQHRLLHRVRVTLLARLGDLGADLRGLVDRLRCDRAKVR